MLRSLRLLFAVAAASPLWAEDFIPPLTVEERNEQSQAIRHLTTFDAQIYHVNNDPNEAAIAVTRYKSGRPMQDVDLASLRPLKHLRTLHLNREEFSDAAMANLAGMTRLEDMMLNSANITGEGLAHLSSMKSLKRVSIDAPRMTDAGVANLAKIPSIERLGLNCPALSDEGLMAIRKLPNLLSLGLYGTRPPRQPAPWTDAALRDFTPHKEFENLTIYGASWFQGQGLSGFASSNLKRLLIADSSVTDAGLKSLTSLTALEDLTFLSCWEITDDGLAPLAQLNNLRKLRIAGNAKLTDASARRLAGLTDLEELEYDRLSAAGLEGLAGLDKLRKLTISGRGITDECIKPLSRLAELKELNLNRTALTKSGLSHLRAALPNTKITAVDRR